MKRNSYLVAAIVLAILALGASSVLAGTPPPGNRPSGTVTPPFPQPPEKDLQKIIFIRYAPGFQKDKPCDNDGVCDPEEKGWCADCKGGEEPTPTPEATACYDFLLGSKPRWNWVEGYAYGTGDLGSTSAWATGVWDAATSATIFGSGASETYPWGVYDLVNSVSYGDYPETGVIAVTAIWFRGKNIYEYDILFDNDYFPGGGVDLDTVALHEFGHGAGLDDLYDVVCSGEVMYWRYTGEKRTLGNGDIAGIETLYGK